MGKYDHLSKEELIQRIERLEADLEKATLTPSASDNELEMRQSQHTINFLNILMDTILSNVFVEITVKDIFNGFRYIYFKFWTVSSNRLMNKHLTEYLKSNGND